MTPLVKFPDTTAILPPRYMGQVGYYAAMARYGHVVVDAALHYDKRQKDVHRCEIADTRGLLRLTVPLGKPHGCDHAPTWTRRCRPTTNGGASISWRLKAPTDAPHTLNS